MNVHHYTVVFQKEPEGGYTAIVPVLTGCVTYGETLEAASEAVQEAIDSYLGSLKKDHIAPPSDISFVSTVDVPVSSRATSTYAKTSLV